MSYELDCMLTNFFLEQDQRHYHQCWDCHYQVWIFYRRLILLQDCLPDLKLSPILLTYREFNPQILTNLWSNFGYSYIPYDSSHFIYFRFLFDEEVDEEGLRKKSRRRRMREKISMELADVAASYGLVRFQPLVVTDERLIRNVILQVKRK